MTARALVPVLLVLALASTGSSSSCGWSGSAGSIGSVGVGGDGGDGDSPPFEPDPDMGAPDPCCGATRSVEDPDEEPPPEISRIQPKPCPPGRWFAERNRCMKPGERRVIYGIDFHRGW